MFVVGTTVTHRVSASFTFVRHVKLDFIVLKLFTIDTLDLARLLRLPVLVDFHHVIGKLVDVRSARSVFGDTLTNQ